MIQCNIQVTDDGSHTIQSTQVDETYHSTHGAIQESQHVFIDHGFDIQLSKFNKLSICEVGFGTGLNALLTIRRMNDLNKLTASYIALEPYPIDTETISALNYPSMIGQGLVATFKHLHASDWNCNVHISQNVTLYKIQQSILDYQPSEPLNLIYFDLFSPNTQPELWKSCVFKKLYNALMPDGVLLTYCSKGVIKRRLKECGFMVERLSGPPGKRHILRATRLA